MQKTATSRFSELCESNALEDTENVQPIDQKSWGEISSHLGENSIDSGFHASELAHYIAHMTGSMAHMARTAHLDSLAYFLEMATIEARTLVKQKVERSF